MENIIYLFICLLIYLFIYRVIPVLKNPELFTHLILTVPELAGCLRPCCYRHIWCGRGS
jgi:hypothetical protein